MVAGHEVSRICVVPALSQASTSSLVLNQDVDGRDEPGHDARHVDTAGCKNWTYSERWIVSTR
jgi:hypothetical protein